MVELETSTLATSATMCLIEMVRTSLGIRTADAMFATQQHGSLAGGLGQNPTSFCGVKFGRRWSQCDRADRLNLTQAWTACGTQLDSNR